MHLYSYVIIYIMILYDILHYCALVLLFYSFLQHAFFFPLLLSFLSYLLLLVLALAACFFWLASYSCSAPFFFLSFLALFCTLPSYRVCLLLPSVSPIAACNVFSDDAPPCCRHGVGGYALYTHILQSYYSMYNATFGLFLDLGGLFRS